MFLFSCKKDRITINTRPKDIDGNIYDTIVIGTQTWMVQNLKTTRYNDGTSITTDLSNYDWTTTSSGAYAIYSSTFGNLYNWYAVKTGKLAPKGWHIPTKNEWDILITYSGGDLIAGGNLKDTSILWVGPNVGATNKSGFSVLPGGNRSYDDGTFNNIGIYGRYWSFSEGISGTIWCYSFNNNNTNVSNGQFYINSGYSVRCIRD